MSGFPKYIHLRVHTEYSLLEGATRLKKPPELCKANDMPAIALTETNNLFSALEFSVLFKDTVCNQLVAKLILNLQIWFQRGGPNDCPNCAILHKMNLVTKIYETKFRNVCSK